MTATVAEEHGWLVKWTPAELAQFAAWIRTAPVADLERHRNRIAAGARLGGFSEGTRRDLAALLDARCVALGVRVA